MEHTKQQLYHYFYNFASTNIIIYSNMIKIKNQCMGCMLAAIPLLSLNTPCMAQNPYLPLWEHVPDGEPRVFEDPDNPGKYRAYIIGSHDTSFKSYC